MTVFEPITLQTITNHQTLTRILHCDITLNLNVLIGFTIILHIACFVQAFRGRRLPGAFKETMSIVYGNFICIAILVILYPIVIFQKDILQQEIIYWLAITINMNVLVVFCYCRRIYVAVFQSEMNTVHFARSAVMQKMNKDAQKRIQGGQ